MHQNIHDQETFSVYADSPGSIGQLDAPQIAPVLRQVGACPSDGHYDQRFIITSAVDQVPLRLP